MYFIIQLAAGQPWVAKTEPQHCKGLSGRLAMYKGALQGCPGLLPPGKGSGGRERFLSQGPQKVAG